MFLQSHIAEARCKTAISSLTMSLDVPHRIAVCLESSMPDTCRPLLSPKVHNRLSRPLDKIVQFWMLDFGRRVVERKKYFPQRLLRSEKWL